MDTEANLTELLQIFVTIKARPQTTMFDWLRMVEEVNLSMDMAVDPDSWESFQIYGSSSDAFERLPQICYQALVTRAALSGLREHIAKQGEWLLPIGIHVAASVEDV